MNGHKKFIALNPCGVINAAVAAEFEYLRRPETGPNEVLFRPVGMADQIRPQDILANLGGELPVANSRRCFFRVPSAVVLELLAAEAFFAAKDLRDHILAGQANGLTPVEAVIMVEAADRVHTAIKLTIAA